MISNSSTDVKSTVKLASKQKSALVQPDSFNIKVQLPCVSSSFHGIVEVELLHCDQFLFTERFTMVQNVGLDNYVQTAFTNYQNNASIPKD